MGQQVASAFHGREWQARLDLAFRGLEALPLVAELAGHAVG
ncbi:MULTISPECIES: hypothetical protein [unclassified Halomonas]|nr:MULTISPECIES: hypothetical protein [unclassified Halomonas]UZH10718.1 hypothetical protein OM794_02875 [Halomonas sp. BDJS001]